MQEAVSHILPYSCPWHRRGKSSGSRNLHQRPLLESTQQIGELHECCLFFFMVEKKAAVEIRVLLLSALRGVLLDLSGRNLN